MLLKQLVEKYKEKIRAVYVLFMNLRKAYDRVSREELWKVLYGYIDEK